MGIYKIFEWEQVKGLGIGQMINCPVTIPEVPNPVLFVCYVYNQKALQGESCNTNAPDTPNWKSLCI